MKIILPENISDITLNQFQKYDVLLKRTDLNEEQFNKRKIEIFTGLERSKIELISIKDYKDIVSQIDKAINEPCEFLPTFKIKNIEFGFIPNLDKITMGEYRDLSLYGKEIETMHKLMAVLFRPIIKKDVFNNYKIESYNGTEKRAEVMKYMPMNIVNGALVFFSSLANELMNYTQKYMQVEQARVE